MFLKKELSSKNNNIKNGNRKSEREREEKSINDSLDLQVTNIEESVYFVLSLVPSQMNDEIKKLKGKIEDIERRNKELERKRNIKPKQKK